MFYVKIDSSYYYEIIESNNYSTSTLSYMISDIFSGIVDKFKVVADIANNIIEISTTDNNLTFKILTDIEAAEVYPSPLNSINGILMNNNPKLCSISSNYVSGYINLSTIRNIYIYISSANLGGFNTINIGGNNNNIIKKVPIRANFNEIVFDECVLGIDFIDVSKQSLSRIELKLTDHDNNVINLNGNHWSCSLIFSKYK